MSLLDQRTLIRRFVSIVEEEREVMVASYCRPPRDGEDYDIETIRDRSAYNKVKRMDRALAAAKIVMSQKSVRK